MDGEGQFFGEVKLTGDLGIGTERLFATEVNVDEVVPRTPVVGLELFESNGNLLTSCLFVWIKVTTKVIMCLNVKAIMARDKIFSIIIIFYCCLTFQSLIWQRYREQSAHQGDD